MDWIPGRNKGRGRRRFVSLPAMIEILESRALLADGITANAAQPITAVPGVPINNGVFATYSVSDPSGEPGSQWRALINFGDGQADGPLVPLGKGKGFEFEDTHT